eukprot:5290566-Pleurochrysis_carterae.AAC.2
MAACVIKRVERTTALGALQTRAMAGLLLNVDGYAVRSKRETAAGRQQLRAERMVYRATHRVGASGLER